MVFFTCSNCGDSVKKPAVQKHYQFKCKKSIVLTCMDCLKDFDEYSYQTHTKCISEEQRYSGKDYVPKESSYAGLKKQETWLEVVKSVILNPQEYPITPEIKQILLKLQSYENIPRKKAKFENFVANNLHIRKNKAEAVWELLAKALEKFKSKLEEEKQNKGSQKSSSKALDKEIRPEDNGTQCVSIESVKSNKENEQKDEKPIKRKKPAENENILQDGSAAKNNDDNDMHVEPEKKKKKRDKNQKECNNTAQIDDTIVEEQTKEVIELEIETFNWETAIKKLIAKKPNGIQLDKLKEKIFKKYKSYHNVEDISNKVQKKFDKKVKKLSFVVVENDVVKMTK